MAKTSPKSIANLSSPPKVLVTIKPIHSLVAAVMEGVGTPELLIEANASAHTHQLKPTEALKLNAAQVIVWVGPIYETAIQKSIDAVKKSVQLITVSDLPGIHLLPARTFHHPVEGCVADLLQCHEGHQHEGDHHHEISGKDGHLWLAAPNAKVIVKGIAAQLSQLDQRNAPHYLANSKKIIKKIDELHADLTKEMEAVKSAKYLTYHDFTQYFDMAYGTECVGAVRVNPEVEPTAATLQDIRHEISHGVKAIFSEPQFDTKTIRIIAEDTDVTYAQLDGLGFGLDAGPNLYFEMMRRFANDMKKALAPH
ncbi:MAG: zinc ABC transporter substrate-binding protein [Candidatus Paracaedibacteraceae bacterium]|nr:zinc ABC transporter substrate-binding protein [Candidatus Paracaedibacteraceae bacterium]